MRKKIYHIVDPDTGRVVGEKRVGAFGYAYYETPPKDRWLIVMEFMGLYALLISSVTMVAVIFVPDWLESCVGWTSIICSAICFVNWSISAIAGKVRRKTLKGSGNRDGDSFDGIS